MAQRWTALGLALGLLGTACGAGGPEVVSDPSTAPKPAPSPAVAAAAPKAPSPPAAPPQTKYSPEVEARIERVLRGLLPATDRSHRFGAPAELAQRMRLFHTPGVSIAVINDGKIEWARGFGVRDAKTKEPMTAETILQAASISKAVFALAVMRLVEQGKLQLDEDVDRYLQSWKVPANGEWRPVITLRELLSHSAGMTVHGFLGYHDGDALPSVPQILSGAPPANSLPVRVDILPETGFRYSGGGTTIAQLAVTEHLGQPFPSMMRDLVLGPLDMKHSTYEQPLPEDRRSAAATAHVWGGQPVEGKWHTYPEMAAAGLWTTPSDLCNVGLEVQRTIRGESKLLSKGRAKEMLTRQLGPLGVGFFIQGKGDTERFGHNGENVGFVSLSTFYENKGLGAVIMMNAEEGEVMLAEIERSIAREYQWPDYFEEDKKRIDVQAAELDRLAGTYESEKGAPVVLARDGKDLTIKVGKQPAVRISPYEPTKFFATDLELEVVFKVEGKKPAESLTVEQGRVRMQAKRTTTSAPMAKRP